MRPAKGIKVSKGMSDENTPGNDNTIIIQITKPKINNLICLKLLVRDLINVILQFSFRPRV